MSKFHVNSNGEPGKCTATKGNCPFGDINEHFDSIDEARNFYEESQKDSLVTHAKKKIDPREHDTEIYELYDELNKIEITFGNVLTSIEKRVGVKVPVDGTMEDYFDFVDKNVKDRFIGFRLDEAKGLFKKHNELSRELNKLDRKYTGWSRFYLVPGGHIHSSTRCSTCNKSYSRPTRFSWLPELSGKTDEEAVNEQGALLCTVCYPDAPTEWTNAHELKRQERAKERCPGSGTSDYDQNSRGLMYYRKSAKCLHCNKSASVTDNMVLRAHKP